MKEADIWIGGYYELTIEFQQGLSEGQMLVMSTIVKQEPAFVGFYKERADLYVEAAPLLHELTAHKSLYGMIQLARGQQLPCVVEVLKVAGEADYLHIAIPQGSLEDQFPYQYPLSKKSNSWLAVIDEWFIVLAKAIYEEIPFEGALIGEEVSGLQVEEVTVEHLAYMSWIVPFEKGKQVVSWGQGQELTKDLMIYR
ncbi:hypothetical protein [Alkalihalobacillus pseudalcaliphilus]|uniref:hypothetical protein n=1 Tax=Alkalihalobacillus pseudalcaliphilus TaxID=79884 RepID=UPI00064E093F|nr:hypothetical protein [Alkalihalobacillus pseudalcaliphilus]KMK75888.1 hypothetical protein AB990_11545 [Alkalihalobacillus pseudalcaliphilus]